MSFSEISPSNREKGNKKGGYDVYKVPPCLVEGFVLIPLDVKIQIGNCKIFKNPLDKFFIFSN